MFKTLEAVPLFKDVDNHILKLLEPLFEQHSCPPATAIFEQGQPAKYLYLILGGSVEIRYKPYDGPPIIITSLRKGSIFGWSAVVGNTVYTSGAICKEHCQTIRISRGNLQKLCKEDPDAGRIILNLLADSVSSRWSNAKNQIQSLLKDNVNARQEANAQLRGARKET